MSSSMKLISCYTIDAGDVEVLVYYAPDRNQYHVRKFREDSGVMISDCVFLTKRAALAAARK